MVRSQFEPYWHSFKILGTQFRKDIQLFLAWFKQVSINQSNFTLTLFCCKFLENVFSQILSGPNCFVFVAIMRNVLRLSFVEHGQTRTSQRPWWGRHCNRIYPPNLNSADPWWFLQHLRQFPRGLRVFVEKLGAVRVSIYISLSSKTQKTFKIKNPITETNQWPAHHPILDKYWTWYDWKNLQAKYYHPAHLTPYWWFPPLWWYSWQWYLLPKSWSSTLRMKIHLSELWWCISLRVDVLVKKIIINKVKVLLFGVI